MSIEILSIGNELLSGRTVNTNASMISKALLKRGFTVDRVTSLPDHPDRLSEGIQEAMKRSSFIIASGGLGPTGDDLTRDIVAHLYKTPLQYDEKVANDLRKRFGAHLKTLKNQAMIPKGGEVILNRLGTAPGFILEGNASMIVLPGVSSQMESMLFHVCDYLERKRLKKYHSEALYLTLLSEQDVDPYLRELEKSEPGLQIGICPSGASLSIYFLGEDRIGVKKGKEAVAHKFHDHVYSTSDKEIALAVHRWMVKRGKTCASAESCTGGRIAAKLTEHSGASDYFLGGVIGYSNHLKESVLKVGADLIKSYGAVSQEVVCAMATGVQSLTDADYALATSGIAGPLGAAEGKPVGTVWVAIKAHKETFSGLVPFKTSPSSRSFIMDYSATYLLASLYRYINFNIEPFG